MTVLNRLTAVRIWLLATLWFVPGGCVVAGIGLAVGLTALDIHLGNAWIGKGSYLFGVGAEGSRGMLSAIAGSMMTVASLTFSLTISTLATAASQYTSRLIRNFIRDTFNQFVLGYFVGLFSYCLVVLRAIRGGDEGAFVPSLAVFGGLVLAVVSVGVLVFFIHHIAESIQASVILDRVAGETTRAVEHLYPADAGQPASAGAGLPDAARPGSSRYPVAAGVFGYVQTVDTETLAALAEDHDAVVYVEADVGAFVTAGTALLTVAAAGRPGDDLTSALRAAVAVGSARTIEQDPAFGIRQIVDIGLKALSPGVNDTTTGVMCVDHLGVVLDVLAGRRIPDHYRAKGGTVRLHARGRTFRALVELALDQIRLVAGKNVAVLAALLRAVAAAGRRTTDPARLAVLREQAALVAAVAHHTLDYPHDRDVVRADLTAACDAVAGPDPHRWLPARRDDPAHGATE